MEQRIKHTGCQRNADNIIEEGPKQVLLDVADGSPRQFHRCDSVDQVALHQHNVRGLNGHVGASADGNAHIGPRQRRSVVDAVSHHGNPFALLLQGRNMALLIRGQHLCNDLRQPQLPADGLGGPLVIACEHHHLEALLPEAFDGGAAGGFDRIRHRDHSHRGAVADKKQRCFAFLRQAVGRRLVRAQRNARIGQHGCVAGQVRMPGQGAAYAFSMHRFKARNRQKLHAAPGRFLHNGCAQRMLRWLFQAGRRLQKRLLGDTVQRNEIRHTRLSFGNGSGFVQHHCGHGPQRLQPFRGLDQNPVLRTLAGSHHDGHRCGKPQGAGAGDHQHRHARRQRLLGAVPGQQPDGGGNQRDGHHHRNKNPGHAVCQLGDGRLGGGRFVHQADHLRQRRIFAHPGGAQRQRAGLVDGRGNDRIPRPLVGGNRLAGQRRFIDRRNAFHHHAVHRHRCAGPHQHQIADPDLLHRYFRLHAIPQNGGSLGGKIHQARNGLAGFPLGTGLQIFSDCNQGNNHGCRLEVKIHGIAFHGFHVPMPQAIADKIQRNDTVNHSGRSAYRNQGIHIGRAVPQGLKPDPEVFLIDNQRWNGQQKQRQGIGHGVLHPVEEAWDGPAHHMPHGEVKQRNHKDNGSNQPPLHIFQIVLHRLGRRLRLDGGARRRLGHRRTVPRLHNGIGDLFRRQRAVPFHRHGAAQQVDVHFLHAFQLSHRLVHMGRTG